MLDSLEQNVLTSLGFTIVSETFITKACLQLGPNYNRNCQIQSLVWPEKKTLTGLIFETGWPGLQGMTRFTNIVAAL